MAPTDKILSPEKSRILLIEENHEVARSIIEWLSDTAVITHVSEHDEILTMIRSQTWELIITDTQLPTLNDLDVTKLVKAIDPLTPVLIVTENQKINFILHALQHHADGLQFKPLDKSEFLDLALRLIKESEVRRTQKRKIILGISAHPDDVEIGCGGSLARHHAKGDIIHILILSRGESGGDPDVRETEAKNAAKILHANLHLGSLTDTKISEGIATIKFIEDIVSIVNPTHIYTHSTHDNHRDHRNVYHATVSACRQIPNLFCYQSPSSTVDFKPNLFMEIFDKYLEIKLNALACYESQCKLRPYLREDMIRSTALYWGRFCNYGLAEPMEVIRQKVETE